MNRLRARPCCLIFKHNTDKPGKFGGAGGTDVPGKLRERCGHRLGLRLWRFEYIVIASVLRGAGAVLMRLAMLPPPAWLSAHQRNLPDS